MNTQIRRHLGIETAELDNAFVFGFQVAAGWVEGLEPVTVAIREWWEKVRLIVEGVTVERP